MGAGWGGSECSGFPLFKSLKFPVAKELRGHGVSASSCLLVCIETLHRNLSCLSRCWSMGECTVGNVQPFDSVAWDKLHSNSMCSSTQVLMHHLNPAFLSYPDKFILYCLTFFLSGIFMSSQSLCEWTCSGAHEVVLDDFSNDYISRIKQRNGENVCHSCSLKSEYPWRDKTSCQMAVPHWFVPMIYSTCCFFGGLCPFELSF